MVNIAKFSDIKQRLITGFIFFAIIFASGYYLGFQGFMALFALIMTICAYEWAGLSRQDTKRAKIYAGVFFVLLSLIIQYPSLYFILLLILPILMVLHLRYDNNKVSLLTGLVYLAIATAVVIFVLARSAMWWQGIFLIWVMVMSVDIGAYVVGRIIGGKKLAPTISPAKTISGFLGGVLFGAVVFVYLVIEFNSSPENLLVISVIGILLSAVAQIGDLYQSFMKRRVGVKDSGVILPGHGGIFDRIDGLVMVLAFIPYSNMIFGSFGG